MAINNGNFFYGTMLSPVNLDRNYRYYSMWGMDNTSAPGTEDQNWFANKTYDSAPWAGSNFASCKLSSIYQTSVSANYYLCFRASLKNNYLPYCSPFKQWTGAGINIGPPEFSGSGRNFLYRIVKNGIINYGMNLSIGVNQSNADNFNSMYWVQIPNQYPSTFINNSMPETETDNTEQWGRLDRVNNFCNVSRWMKLYYNDSSTPYLVDVGGYVPSNFNSSYSNLDSRSYENSHKRWLKWRREFYFNSKNIRLG